MYIYYNLTFEKKSYKCMLKIVISIYYYGNETLKNSHLEKIV